MNLLEAYLQISLIKRDQVSKADIAKALNVTKQYISSYFKKDKQLTVEKIKQLEDFFNVELSGNPQQDDSVLRIKVKKNQKLLIEYEE